MSTGEATGAVRVRVWDLPLRLFHWCWAVVVVAAVITGQVGGNAMEWHLRLGQTALALLVFRLLWGLVGGRWSRFVSFLYGPAALVRYLTGRPRIGERFDIGHSPLGGLSVWALLGVGALQVVSGLMADDEIATAGPLAARVDEQVVSWATHIHTEWGLPALIAFVGLHLLAVVVYRLRGKPSLVRPMVTGDKWLPAGAEPSRDGWVQRVLALVLCVVAAAVSVGVFRQGGV